MTRAFFDTNILVYAVISNDPKRAVAVDRLRSGFIVSVQTLNEYANVLSRKLRWEWTSVNSALGEIRDSALEIVPLSVDVHSLGMHIAGSHKLAIYDAMIVAAALSADCDTLYSEDMHDGLVVDGRLTIVNPFRAVTA